MVRYSSLNKKGTEVVDQNNIQLKQGQVRICIVRLVLALLHYIVLEHGRCLGIVSIESIQDGIDVLWPVGRVVERSRHGELMDVAMSL